MEQILKIALEAEQKARNTVAQALNEKARCDENIAQTDKIYKRYLEEATERIAAFENKEKLKSDVQCEKLDRELCDNIARLEELYKTRKDQWVDKMYGHITEKL